MKKLTIAVQMDPLPLLNVAQDSTLMMMREAQSRGYLLYQYMPEKLSLKNGLPVAHVQSVTLHDDPKQWYTLGAPEPLPLAEADVVLMRQDPPYHMAYITAAHMLEFLRGKTLVVNDPAAVRNFPEKLFPVHFAAFTPPTLISANAGDIRAFHREQHEIVLKPLYGYGGEGVFHIGADGANLNALLELLLKTDRTPLVAQKFLAEVKTEERRIIIIDGRVIGLYARVPADGEIRANVHSGGSPKAAEFTRRQKEICEAVGPVLKENGLLFAGLDVVGDWLTEINITSPTGFVGLKTFYGLSPERDFWDAIEKRL